METFEIITTAINVVTILLAVITFVVSACQYRRQQKLSFFEKYTARLQEGDPECIGHPRFYSHVFLDKLLDELEAGINECILESDSRKESL